MKNHRWFPDSYFAGMLMLLASCLLFQSTLQAKDDLPSVPPDARAPLDTLFHEPLLRGLHLAFQDRFEESIALFDSLQQEAPDHPAPYFFRAAVYQNWMNSFRVRLFQDRLEKNVKLAIEKGKVLLKKGQDDPWIHFYLGAAYGYRGIFRARRFNWIGAFLDGKKGVSNFKKALEKEPRLYDAYLGLGYYHYWRTARSSFIKIIAFWMSDKRELGIQQIDFARQHGRYTPPEANYALALVLYDYQKYRESLRVLEKTQAGTAVQNIAELYLLGRLMVHFENWSRVQEIFSEILARLQSYPYPSVNYQVECKYWIACALKNADRLVQALALTQEARLQSAHWNKESELEGFINDFNEVKGWLEELKKTLVKQLDSQSLINFRDNIGGITQK